MARGVLPYTSRTPSWLLPPALASARISRPFVLRRIGHLPQDKGLEIARQICAGLAAAHDCACSIAT